MYGAVNLTTSRETLEKLKEKWNAYPGAIVE